MQVPQHLGELGRILVGVAPDDRAADRELGDVDALLTERLVQELGECGLVMGVNLPDREGVRPSDVSPTRHPFGAYVSVRE